MPVHLLGLFGPVLDVIDWSKLAIPASVFVIFSVAYYVSKKLAERSGAVQLDELKSKLKTESEAHAAARATIQALHIQQATHAAAMEAQLNAVKSRDEQLAKNQAAYAKVFAAGQKLYQEVKGLRETKQQHDRLKIEHAQVMTQAKTLEDDLIGRDEKLTALRDNLTIREKQLEQAERRMRRARRLSGYLLKAKALQARPKFTDSQIVRCVVWCRLCLDTGDRIA